MSKTDHRMKKENLESEQRPAVSSTARNLEQRGNGSCNKGGQAGSLSDGLMEVIGASNCPVSQSNIVGVSYGPVISNSLPSLTERIAKRTLSSITTWTKDMVYTSALRKVMEKLNSGITWITIKGSPGEGKTTTAFMALEELHKSGREVFKVIKPEEFREVTLNCSQPFILLDDVFGHLEFEKHEWLKWKPVLSEVLGEAEHICHQKRRGPPRGIQITVILVGRDYVLNSTSSNIGKFADFFTCDRYVVCISSTTRRDTAEKRAIWEAIAGSCGLTLDGDIIERICNVSGPHGFPHTCRLFVTSCQDDHDVDAVSFFKSPLPFLNQTVNTFTKDPAKRDLFKEMIKRNGQVSEGHLQEVDRKTIMVAESLTGTYLRKEGRDDDDYFMFHHPSVYDSVAFNLCENYTEFVIENCTLSFVHERIRLKPSPGSQRDAITYESNLVAYIPRRFKKQLAQRFAAEVFNGNLFQVFSHKAFTDEGFVQTFMSSIQIPLPKLLEQTDINTNEEALCLIVSSKSPLLLKYIESDKELSESEMYRVLYGVCEHAACDVLTYLMQTHPKMDISVTFKYKRTPLMVAAMTRDSKFVQQIMSLNPDVNALDRWGKTVLHYLCENGLMSAAAQVIDRGVDVNMASRYRYSPLDRACFRGLVDVVKFLLESGARWDVKTVVDVCKGGNIDIVMLLFEKGATVEMRTKYDTALTAGCEGGNMEVIRFLIDKGASVNTADWFGRSPLHVACEYNKSQAVECLLDHGAVTDSRDRWGNTPLHKTAERGFKECAEVLVNAGVDIAVQNTIGDTPLHVAAKSGSQECVKVILMAGASVNVQNAEGSTPLYRAIERRSKECVDVLLKAGANVDTTNTQGQTPLHVAVHYKISDLSLPDTSVCQTLIRHGANVNKQDTCGNTPLHLLCQIDSHTKIHKDWPPKRAHAYKDVYRTLVKLLIDNGSDVNIHNEQGQLALRGWCQTLSY